MRTILSFLKFSLISLCASGAMANDSGKTAFDFSFEDIDGSPYPLAQHQGNVLVIINTATDCGFAAQLGGMQQLWEAYKDKDVVVISVPSNDFNDQETRSNEEIVKHCAAKYNATYPIVAKTHVRNYENAHPLYKWVVDTYGDRHTPNWNFSKLVFDRKGNLVDSFSSITGPESARLRAAISQGLAP